SCIQSGLGPNPTGLMRKGTAGGTKGTPGRWSVAPYAARNRSEPNRADSAVGTCHAIPTCGARPLGALWSAHVVASRRKLPVRNRRSHQASCCSRKNPVVVAWIGKRNHWDWLNPRDVVAMLSNAFPL